MTEHALLQSVYTTDPPAGCSLQSIIKNCFPRRGYGACLNWQPSWRARTLARACPDCRGNRGNLKVGACLNGSLTMLSILFFFDYWSALDRVVRCCRACVGSKSTVLMVHGCCFSTESVSLHSPSCWWSILITERCGTWYQSFAHWR